MEFFVSPSGDDANPGTEDKPYRTIARGLRGPLPSPTSALKPGDILTLRGGTYVEAVRITNLAGAPGNEITIRSFRGERAVIDACLPEFSATGTGAWVRASTVDPASHPDEWASARTFPDAVDPNRGAFLGLPYRRLVTYSTQRDFRSNSQTFDKIFEVDPPNLARSPWKVTDEQFNPIRDPDTGRDGAIGRRPRSGGLQRGAAAPRRSRPCSAPSPARRATDTPQGYAVGIGPGRRAEATGELIPLDVRVGDSVVFVGDHAVEVSAQGQSLVMVPSGDVLAVVGL